MQIKNLSSSNPPTLREIASKSIITLRIEQNKVDQATYRLRERDKLLFEQCANAYKINNKAKANICAGEIAEIRKLTNFLYNMSLAIERVVLRLETMKELSDIIIDLKPALRLLQDVSSDLFQFLPDVSEQLNSVNSAITETLHATKITTDESVIPVGRKTEGGEEILREAAKHIEKKLFEELPEPPATTGAPEKIKTKPIREMVALSTTCSQVTGRKNIGELGEESSQTLFSYKKSEIKEISLTVEKPSVEDMLLEYVRKTNGEIDLTRCSSDLKTSNEEIEKALETLGNKGKIKIELKSPD